MYACYSSERVVIRHLAHGAFVTSGPASRAEGPFLIWTLGRSAPQHHPPIHKPCTTTRFPMTSPINIFRKPEWGLLQFGIPDSPWSIGECSEKAAPFLNIVIRRRDKV
jgi:hypothetical protein